MSKLQRASTIRHIDPNATGVDASSLQPAEHRQLQYTQSMPPEAFQEDELDGLLIDSDADGVHATTVGHATLSSSGPTATNVPAPATTSVEKGSTPFVHTHLQPTTHHTQHPTAFRTHTTHKGRAVSEPPTYAMDLDSDPPSGSGSSGDVEMRLNERDDGVNDSTLSGAAAAYTLAAGAPPTSRRTTHGVSRPTPLGRWHTDFVIRIRIPGDGKGEDKGVAHLGSGTGADLGERLDMGSGTGEERGEDERTTSDYHYLASQAEHEPDIELSQPVYTSYSYPNASGDEDEIDESQTSNPFLRSPSASPSSPSLAPEADAESDTPSQAAQAPILTIPSATTPTTHQPAPPSPAATEIEFPESQDITVDIQRRGVRIRDFAYAPPYVLEIKAASEEEKGTEPNTPAASFYHGGISSPINVTHADDMTGSGPESESVASRSVYPPYRTPEIFDPYKAMTEVDYRWTQPIRTFAIAGKTLRRLLDMGWLSESEVKEKASEEDLEELRMFDEKRRMEWDSKMGEKEIMGFEGKPEVDDKERLRREMEVFPWRWIRKARWVKLAGGIQRDDDDDEDEAEAGEAPLPPLPVASETASSSSSASSETAPLSTSKPLPALPLPPVPPPKYTLPPPPAPFEPGTIPPLSTSSLADLIAYIPPPTLITSLPPFPPAPRLELRALWVDIKRGYWRQVDRMWIVGRERELRRRQDMEEAGRKVKEIDERLRLGKFGKGVNGKRECSPGKRRIEGEEDDMDVQEDFGAGAGVGQEQGGVKRRRLSPPTDENLPPSSAASAAVSVASSQVSAQRGTRPSPSSCVSSVSRSGNPHLQVHPAPVSSSHHSPHPSSTSYASSLYSLSHLVPPEKQYPAPAAAYNPRLYPDARNAKRAQAGIIDMNTLSNGKSGGKGKLRGAVGEEKAAPLERQDTPILEDEDVSSQGPSSSASQQNAGDVRVSSAHQGQKLVHPKKTLGGLSRQKSFNELLA